MASAKFWAKKYLDTGSEKAYRNMMKALRAKRRKY